MDRSVDHDLGIKRATSESSIHSIGKGGGGEQVLQTLCDVYETIHPVPEASLLKYEKANHGFVRPTGDAEVGENSVPQESEPTKTCGFILEHLSF